MREAREAVSDAGRVRSRDGCLGRLHGCTTGTLDGCSVLVARFDASGAKSAGSRMAARSVKSSALPGQVSLLSRRTPVGVIQEGTDG